MKNSDTSKIALIPAQSNMHFEEQSKHDLCTLTHEEIQAVAGGPEVEVGTGTD